MTLEYCDKVITATNVQREIWKEKYSHEGETLPSENFKRVATGLSEENADKYYDLMANLRGLPAGRILEGVGNKRESTLLNCFVIPIKDDSLDAIFQFCKEAALTYKTGGGVGTDISCLRPAGAEVNNSARYSTGAVSFIDLFSNVTKTVGQNARRGALMVSLDIQHPDILDFIKLKDDENKEIATGANLSVKIRDAFMVAMQDEADWELWYPTLVKQVPEGEDIWEVSSIYECYDYPEYEFYKVKLAHGQHEYRQRVVYKTMQAKTLWDELVKRAHAAAEPGVLFIDTIKEDHNIESQENIISTNPCICKNNWILTDEGYKQVEELIGKEFKVPYNGGVYRSISNGFFKTGIKKVYEVVFSNYKSIKCTINHKFFTSEDTKEEIGKLVGSYVIGSDTEHTELDKFEVEGITLVGEEEVFDCTIEEIHRYNCNGIIISNCAELPLQQYGACNLGALNFYAFVQNKFSYNAFFDFDAFETDVRTMVRMLDDVIDLTHGKNALKEQDEQLLKYRKIGGGIMGFADCLAALRIPYDSHAAIEMAEHIGSVLEFASYTESHEMAKEKGAYPGFNKVIEGHVALIIAKGIISEEDYLKYGIRNATLNTVAPTGTTGTMVGCSTGIEPIFDLEYTRNSESLDTSWKVYHRAYEEYLETNPKDRKPNFFKTAYEIDPNAKVLLQATLQQYIDNSISITTNLPKDATPEQVGLIYELAWENGCKGQTVYREGSRTQILVAGGSDDRDGVLEGKTLVVPYKDKMYLTLNFHPLTGKPIELFINSGKSGADIKATNEAFGRLTSLFLKQGGNIEDVIKTMVDIHGADTIFKDGWILHSTPDAIAKGLQKLYQTNFSMKCSECGGEIKMESACMLCTNCGYSKCS